MASYKYSWDLEASGLLDSSTVDYTSSPYKLKDNFVVHCAGFEDFETGEYIEFVQEDVKANLKLWLIEQAKAAQKEGKKLHLVGNNTIDYDHLVLKAYLGIDYTVYPDTLCGIPIIIEDNLVLSKTLNPDRQGHSVDYFGEKLGVEKIDWRAKAVELGLISWNSPKGEEFKKFHPEMLVYLRRDVKLSKLINEYLRAEWGSWNWQEAFELESAVREIITRQAHRGFWFDEELAYANIRELDEMMEAIRQEVEPLIPPKPMPKTEQKEYTPPKIQFKKNGELSANIQKWVEKHGGTLYQEGDDWWADVLGAKRKLPLPCESLLDKVPAKITDTTHLKGWLVEMGWKPTQYKERDLTVDAKKKKLTKEKYEAAVMRYVEQTLSSAFMADRCEHLSVPPKSLLDKLMGKDISKPVKVLTNPTLTVGQEKELCPKLLEVAEKFPHAQKVSEYLTYRHRRNSILGGNVDPDDMDEDEEFDKGYLAQERIQQDHRIPTPADTCGAGTSRFKHRVVSFSCT